MLKKSPLSMACIGPALPAVFFAGVANPVPTGANTF
jgi:hypothetical protein